MIFVTVGTSHFPFPRLLDNVALLAKSGKIEDKIVVQKGQAPFGLDRAEVFSFVSPEKFKKLLSQADIVITHGGLVSVVQALTSGKQPPIVVPRQKKFGEHVDDHQVVFVRDLERKRHVLVVYDIDKLEEVLANFEKYARGLRPFSANLEERKKLMENLIRFTESLKRE